MKKFTFILLLLILGQQTQAQGLYEKPNLAIIDSFINENYVGACKKLYKNKVSKKNCKSDTIRIQKINKFYEYIKNKGIILNETQIKVIVDSIIGQKVRVTSFNNEEGRRITRVVIFFIEKDCGYCYIYFDIDISSKTMSIIIGSEDYKNYCDDNPIISHAYLKQKLLPLLTNYKMVLCTHGLMEFLVKF